MMVKPANGTQVRRIVKENTMAITDNVRARRYLNDLVSSIQELVEEAERLSIEERLDFSIQSPNGFGVIEQVWHNSNWSNSEA